VSTAPRLVADVVTVKLDERGGARKLHSALDETGDPDDTEADGALNDV